MTQAATNTVNNIGFTPVTSWENPVTKQIINFRVSGDQDMSSGYVHATPSDYARRMDIRRQDVRSKQINHYAALQQGSPTAKLGPSASVQARGMQQQNALILRARRSGLFSSLKTQPIAPKAEPKAAPQPAPTAMPQSMVVAVGTIAARASLRVVASNDAPTKTNAPAAKPQQPTLAQRQRYWSRSAGYACNLG
jgi:hypothetical protein